MTDRGAPGSGMTSLPGTAASVVARWLMRRWLTGDGQLRTGRKGWQARSRCGGVSPVDMDPALILVQALNGLHSA